MVTLCTSQAVTDRTGTDINATALSSEAIINRFITDAEQTILAETKTDWITSYSSVSTAVQATLKICAASHAGKEIIASDLSGFQTKAEAITKMNVLENSFQRTIKALKDRDIQNIRALE